MNKSLYIFISLLLSINLWDLNILPDFLKPDVFLAIMWIWALLAFVLFPNKKTFRSLYGSKYLKHLYFIFLGVFISMFPAYFFWKQNFITTFIAQRGIYSFILLPAILYAQPKEKEIFDALKWISYGTIAVWVISIFAPSKITSLSAELINEQNDNTTKIGFYVSGFRFILLYFYYILFRLTKNLSFDLIVTALIFLIFFVLFQNRSILIGAVIATTYTFWKINSRYKFLIYLMTGILILGIIMVTINIWTFLWNESIDQLADKDYNRWRSFQYYLFNYSPNWFCYVFGNGFPSGGNSPIGNLMWSNFEDGIYASDLGMIGMWTTYGIIPVLVTYLIVIYILRKKIYPLYLKFFALHLCIVPTIFHFWSGEGVMMMVFMFYLYIYYGHYYSLKNVINYYRQFQKRRENNIICEGGIS